MDVKIRNYLDSDKNSLDELLLEVYNSKRRGNSNSNNLELVARYHNEVVGYLVFNKIYDSVGDFYYGYLNYVCVKEKYRNMGIASSMIEKVFEFCREDNISYIELTSNSKRLAAHFLYKKLGFSTRDTVVFRKEIL